MRILHFEKLRPLCPRCLRDLKQETALEIKSSLKQKEDTIIEGILVCTNEQCQSEFPIIDGIPIIIADLRTYVTQHLFSILNRDDLSKSIESLLGDCAGPASTLDLQKQALSAYGYDHYGDLDPDEKSKESPKCRASCLLQ